MGFSTIFIISWFIQLYFITINVWESNDFHVYDFNFGHFFIIWVIYSFIVTELFSALFKSYTKGDERPGISIYKCYIKGVKYSAIS